MELAWIADLLGARAARPVERLQALWGGYGELLRVALEGAATRTAIVKWARLPEGAPADASSTRKARSFDVETAFYRAYAPRCDRTCRVAALLGARGGIADGEWILVLEDLDAAGYDRRVDEATGATLDAALAWLASFHARFLGERGDGLWPIGTYWQLETRRAELVAIEDPALRAAAPALAARLAAARFQTLVHGDPKEANFCVTPPGGGDHVTVAAVDFQYAGRACAMVDVAYLLYGRADEPADGIDRGRLDAYFEHLRRALGLRADAATLDAAALEAEWRALYPVARLDFCRFLAGWRPAWWRADARGQRFVRATLAAYA